ncbi:MAG: helix-turn-helix transcriptional regulator [Eubacteriales bacterium]|nr:helix-turn-helix transcriptional regulator [Eubacteriales bacterium]
MDIKYIGRNIEKLRFSRGLSQGDLGKEIGLTPIAISNIENAKSYPSVDTLIRFAVFFSVTVDYLLTDKDVKQLEDLQIKSKLLTTEMFLKSGKPQKSLYEIDNKEYFFEEIQNEITYRVSEVDK